MNAQKKYLIFISIIKELIFQSYDYLDVRMNGIHPMECTFHHKMHRVTAKTFKKTKNKLLIFIKASMTLCLHVYSKWLAKFISKMIQ